MYRVVKYFEDLQDGSYPYNVGDEFPREGMTVTEQRLQSLSSDKNKQGTPLIELVEEAKGLDGMTRAELVSLAEDMGFEVPSGATKSVIREMIDQA